MGQPFKKLCFMIFSLTLCATLGLSWFLYDNALTQQQTNLSNWLDSHLSESHSHESHFASSANLKHQSNPHYLMQLLQLSDSGTQILQQTRHSIGSDIINRVTSQPGQFLYEDINDQPHLIFSALIEPERHFSAGAELTQADASSHRQLFWVAEDISDLQHHHLQLTAAILITYGLLMIITITSFQRWLEPLYRQLNKRTAQHNLSWENMTGIAVQLTASGYILDANPRFLSLFGDEEADTLDRILHPDERQRVHGFLQQALSSHTLIDFECTLLDHDQEEGRWALHVKPWHNNNQRYLLLSGDDISKRHHMEQELRAEQQRVSTYIDAMQTLLIVCDQQGHIERSNSQVNALLGKKESDVVMQPVFQLLPPKNGDELQAIWAEFLQRETPSISFECPLISLSGKESIISWRITKVAESTSGRFEVLMAGLDITESVANHRALEVANGRIREALSEAENANHSKSIFLANMSHEIRTPMNGILGAAELLIDSSLNRDQKNYLDIIHSSSHALLDIINDILDLSKIESGKLEVEHIDFDLNKLLTDIYQLFNEPARRKNLSLVYIFEEGLSNFWRGDPKRIRQIITNLLSNALKFTEHGHIEIRACLEHNCNGESGLCIKVKDTGIGIPGDKIEQIFSAFRQADTSTSRRFGGTGLGLTISRRLAHAMDGHLIAESAIGEGSCFCLQLPLQSSQITSIQANKDSRRKVSQLDGQVLLAEDNTVNQKIAAKMLQRLGLQCTIVENGEQALAALLHQDFDLILMDVNMPIMDGITATERIRELTYPKSQVPIIALTANAMMEDKNRCLQSGMNGFISKPIKLDALANEIHQLLGQH